MGGVLRLAIGINAKGFRSHLVAGWVDGLLGVFARFGLAVLVGGLVGCSLHRLFTNAWMVDAGGRGDAKGFFFRLRAFCSY